MICQLEKSLAIQEFILVKIPKHGIFQANNIQEVADLLNSYYIIGPLRKISMTNFSAQNHFVGLRSLFIFHVKIVDENRTMKKINKIELDLINDKIAKSDQDLKFTN